MAYIICLQEEALLTKDSTPPMQQPLADLAVVSPGQAVAVVDHSVRELAPDLGELRLAGPFTWATGAQRIDAGTTLYFNPGRFFVPPEAFSAVSEELISARRIEPAKKSSGTLSVPAKGLSLIPPEVTELNHYYEGFHHDLHDGRVQAYPDPASGGPPITIGWGSTRYNDGSPINIGDIITRKEADDLYEFQCYNQYWKVLQSRIPYWQDMSDKQRAALCSFSYNHGAYFYGNSGYNTISSNLSERDWRAVPGSLMMYRNPGQGVEVGLGRRRRAEGLVWCGMEPSQACSQAHNEIRTPEDCETWEQRLKASPPAVVSDQRQRPEPAEVFTPTKAQPPAEAQPPVAGFITRPLDVYFFSQLDSKLEGERNSSAAVEMCFSSTCAMLARYLKPELFPGPNGDDDYLRQLNLRGGRTTVADCHVDFLRSLGIQTQFTSTASWADLERQIERGLPIPVGWLHHGPASTPVGGGHWSLVIDVSEDHVIMHDPNGEADLVNGGYTPNRDGRSLRYSRKNWGRRWLVGGANDGWAILADT